MVVPSALRNVRLGIPPLQSHHHWSDYFVVRRVGDEGRLGDGAHQSAHPFWYHAAGRWGRAQGCALVAPTSALVLVAIRLLESEGGTMKKLALLLVLFSGFLWAAPAPDDYPVKVHVASSQLDLLLLNGFIRDFQRLDVVINGKKYVLEEGTPQRRHELLALGDYSAKLAEDEHKTAYSSSQTYEFLLPDGKTRKFVVIGQSE